MKLRATLLLPAFIALWTAAPVIGQDDLARDDGLPSRIGVPKCPNLATGRDASLQGSLTVRGTTHSDREMDIEVVVSGSGMPAARKRMKNGGSFSFNCIPKDNVMLTVTINGAEVETMSLGNLMGQPFMNRQDVVVAYSDSAPAPPKPGVVAAEQLYHRSDKTKKLFDDSVLAALNGQVDKATKILQELVSDDPKDFVAWTQLGNFDFNAQKFDSALTEFVTSAGLSPGYSPALLGEGRSYLALKRLEEAIDVLEKAVQSDPNSAEFHHYLGEAYLQSKKGSLAIQHMHKALEIDPIRQAPLHLRLAALYDAAGAKDLAVQECKLLLEAVPDYSGRAAVEKYIADNIVKK